MQGVVPASLSLQVFDYCTATDENELMSVREGIRRKSDEDV
jgi:hypothetical protein